MTFKTIFRFAFELPMHTAPAGNTLLKRFNSHRRIAGMLGVTRRSATHCELALLADGPFSRMPIHGRTSKDRLPHPETHAKPANAHHGKLVNRKKWWYGWDWRYRITATATTVYARIPTVPLFAYLFFYK
ncbi:MAG: hypothetical protein ABR920_13840 [Terriglobales bacterium]